MADHNFDHSNAPPAMTAQQQHRINLRRLYASRFGDISNYEGLVPPQFAGAAPDDLSAAAPSAPSVAAHAVQRVNVAESSTQDRGRGARASPLCT